MAVGKSPLTGGWGDANCGGYLSREIKRAGYDAVFFRGCAAKPTWVYIDEETVEMKDATAVWGRDTVETEDYLKGELNDAKARIAAIGLSGEKRARLAGIVTDGGRIAARSGLGALMGSKNLKAIVLRGAKKVPLADPGRVKSLTGALIADYKKAPRVLDRISIRFLDFISKLIAATGIRYPAEPGTVREIFRRWGTCGLTVYSALIGDMPIRNWNGAGSVDFTFEQADRIAGEKLIGLQKRRYACQGCPLGCGGLIAIQSGKFQGQTGHKPEYETVAAFGGLLLNHDLDAIIEINEMCNRAGIDTISTGAAVGFAIECFENGLLDRKDTDGLTLGWGQSETIVRLTEMIIQRQGIGDVLADGVRAAAAKIGRGAEQFAMHAGGQELPMHDSRLDHGYAITYQCEPTPGRHTIASYQDIALRSGVKQFPAAQRMVKQAKGKVARRVALNVATSLYYQLISTSGLCVLGADTIDFPLVAYLNAVTGWNLPADEYFKTARRIQGLRQGFNVREGVRPEHSKLPDRALGRPPQTKGPLKGVTVDMERLSGIYFDLLGCDPSTGGPRAETLQALDLETLLAANGITAN
jgi:aldehyde:ferredoxin oxidoreductase